MPVQWMEPQYLRQRSLSWGRAGLILSVLCSSERQESGRSHQAGAGKLLHLSKL